MGWWKSIACLEVGPQRGFARETLGEPSTFELWQTSHNNYLVIDKRQFCEAMKQDKNGIGQHQTKTLA